MDLCYFGTVCSWDTFNRMMEKSDSKPSTAAQLFEYNIIKGFRINRNLYGKLELNTFLPDAAFPHGSRFAWHRKRDRITEGMVSKWLPAVNLQILKQICYSVSAFFVLLFWLIRKIGVKEKCIFLYTIYMPVAMPSVLLAKLFRCPIAALVPDLPEFMFSYSRHRGFKAVFIPLFLKLSKFIQNRFDGYILLTEYMNEKVNARRRPHTIVEGMFDPENLKESMGSKPDFKAVMYAGGLNRSYGLPELIEGFRLTDGADYRLWIFGSGEMEDEIGKIAEQDSRIRFFGKRPRGEVLEYELKASLLVNIRPVENEFTRYSFPSKMMEYMASGTPVLTTALPGIPEEYLSRAFILRNFSAQGVSEKLTELLSKPDEILTEKGKEARSFILTEKNIEKQTRKILEFLNLQMI